MSKELMMVSMGLSLFIICPRMARMVNIIAKNSQVSLVYSALFGVKVSPYIANMFIK